MKAKWFLAAFAAPLLGGFALAQTSPAAAPAPVQPAIHKHVPRTGKRVDKLAAELGLSDAQKSRLIAALASGNIKLKQALATILTPEQQAKLREITAAKRASRLAAPAKTTP